mmetsp:Transcript_30214/g.66006  ORF Transcript_30214/g.66006 Transcript_30214/m.66006 type:complete len:200 (-) Transcript_30214:143-742(-)
MGGLISWCIRSTLSAVSRKSTPSPPPLIRKLCFVPPSAAWLTPPRYESCSSRSSTSAFPCLHSVEERRATVPSVAPVQTNLLLVPRLSVEPRFSQAGALESGARSLPVGPPHPAASRGSMKCLSILSEARARSSMGASSSRGSAAMPSRGASSRMRRSCASCLLSSSPGPTSAAPTGGGANCATSAISRPRRMGPSEAS